MIDISVGAVGAAVIAGLVSLLGLIIGKEQKISEFRQAWINDLRNCVVAYLVNINSICDSLRLESAGKTVENSEKLSRYRLLNEASHGIRFRVNGKEEATKALLKSMAHFEVLARANANLTPDRISAAEDGFIEAANQLLKFEWNRVKRGEEIFVWTKRSVFIVVLVMIVLFGYILTQRKIEEPIHGKIYRVSRMNHSSL